MNKRDKRLLSELISYGLYCFLNDEYETELKKEEMKVVVEKWNKQYMK